MLDVNVRQFDVMSFFHGELIFYTNVRLGAADFPNINYDYYHHHHCEVVRLLVVIRDVHVVF